MGIAFAILTVAFIIAIILVRKEVKGTIAVAAMLSAALISSWIAVKALGGNSFSETLYGGLIFGDIPLRLDAFSAWFVLLTNFTAITGILYGKQYLSHYQTGGSDLSLHYSAYILNHAAMTGIFFLQNSLAFLCSWEIMAITAFIMVIFEHGKAETLKAGINYLIQSHISIILLTLGFIWVYAKTGSVDFNSIHQYCQTAEKEASLILFLVFFAGFAIKAGFVPFHTWLPHAHPAAPSHVSGIMSGIIIKTGIYGILRILLLMPENTLIIGYIILAVSVLTGVYGVMMAIIQHNLKRLLAYHSIENIGIIGIGIGIGTIGAGVQNPLMTFMGYAGALLHTLNHSLFKSLLFYTSGNIFHETGTLIIDRMGGLIRTLPRTALFFLIAALAICGLPPFNGFISEVLIFSGLFEGIATKVTPMTLVLSVIGMALIGGLALLCFTKAFGIMFLGTERQVYPETPREAGWATLFPKLLIGLLIVFIGMFPQAFMPLLRNPVALFGNSALITTGTTNYESLKFAQHISLCAWALIVITIAIYLLRHFVQKRVPAATGPTWGCGYVSATPKLQYTASSFVKPYVNIVKPLVEIKKTPVTITEIIPDKAHYESHFYDKLEAGLIDRPTRTLRGFLGRFKFLQNGSVQFYVLYGVVFIAICIVIPLIIDAIKSIVLIINKL